MMKKYFKKNIARVWNILPTYSLKIKVPILCYHSINDKKNILIDSVAPEKFEKHLILLKRNFQVITLKSLVDHLIDKSNIPENAAVITFDDGYVDNYINAFPLLKKHNMPATIFLVSSFINHEINLIPDKTWNGMTWQQAKEMHLSGLIDFGSHAHTHKILSKLSMDEVKNEIITSRNIIINELGFIPDLFAYPNGQGADIPIYSDKILKEIGFRAACSTFWRTSHENTHVMKINRVIVNGNDNEESLILKLSGAYDYIYYIHIFKTYILRFLDNMKLVI